MKRNFVVSSGLPESEKEKTLKELKLGFLNLSDGMFDQAKENFLLVLQYDYQCPDAYWGLMLAKFQLKSEDELYLNPVTNKNAIYLNECEKALQFADDKLKIIYNDLLERIYAINEGENY